MRWTIVLFLCWAPSICAQEAGAGLELHGTVAGSAIYNHEFSDNPRGGGPIAGGFRSILYPTLKLTENWSLTSAVQIRSGPPGYDDSSTRGYGVNHDILQLHLTYSRLWRDRSLVVRVGQLTSAFGSFLLRYDDAINPLVGAPLSYGYYGNGVAISGLTGAQVDATLKRLDVRAQFVNSSPANPRSIFDGDQYGNWAGGAGYTIAPGFRVGISAYRGPYLDRHSEYYFPGEARPRDLPGSAYGLDIQWGRGPWNAYAELQKFQFTYRAIPTFNEHTGYGELRRTVSPRWYVATRLEYLRSRAVPPLDVYAMAVGFRPNRFQILKVGYDVHRGPEVHGSLSNVFVLQLVTQFHGISIARD